jgi:hypothetical protein
MSMPFFVEVCNPALSNFTVYLIDDDMNLIFMAMIPYSDYVFFVPVVIPLPLCMP